MASSTIASSFSLVPPSNFSYIEDSLCRCSYPIIPAMTSFLHSNSIRCIVNISLKSIEGSVANYCAERDIKIIDFLEEPPIRNGELRKFELWTANIINTLMANCTYCNTLLVGSPDTSYDCLVIACMRRVQEWSYVSIISEFRQFCWPLRLYDFEQFIEAFDISLVSTTGNIPDFLLTHYHLKEEEAKLISRYTARRALLQRKERSDAVGEEGIESNDADKLLGNDSKGTLEEAEIDEMLINLLFNRGNKLISTNAQYDPNLSLINDKDEDD